MKNNDLILQKLSKSYHGQVVFSDLSLALSPETPIVSWLRPAQEKQRFFAS